MRIELEWRERLRAIGCQSMKSNDEEVKGGVSVVYWMENT